MENKRDWELDDIVMPEDMNRIEEEIYQFNNGLSVLNKDRGYKTSPSIQNTDVNTLTKNGKYFVDGSNCVNLPNKEWFLLDVTDGSGGGYIRQLVSSYSSNKLFVRYFRTTTYGWTPWKEVATMDRVSNPNLLHNWDFRNPVNQRGKSIYSDYNSYTIDRWLQQISSGGSVSTTVHDGYITVSGGTVVNFFTQRVESKLDFSGNTTYTLSLKLLNGEIYKYSFTGEFVIVVAEGLRFRAYEADNSIQVLVDSGFSFDLVAIKLELGSSSTLANDPPQDYGTELAKCQRYYEEGTVIIGSGGRTDKYALVNAIQFKVRKRIAHPTINLVNLYNNTIGSIHCGGDNKDYTANIAEKDNNQFSVIFTQLGFLENSQFVVGYTVSAEL